jgi:DNA invertase Pin-like site-specific DNA recombinase
MRQDARMAADLLDRILQEIRERKEASRAAYEESERLERALAALGERAQPAQPAPSKPRREPRAPTTRRRPRAPQGENRRRILELVSERPGVTAGEVASVLGIARTTVSTTLSRLASEGAIARTELPSGGVGFRAASQGSTS